MNTVKFWSNKKTKTISLPSFINEEWNNETKVVIKTTRTMWEQRELAKEFPNAGDLKSDDSVNATLAMIKDWIVSWNFTNEDDTPTEINNDNLNSLSDIDFLFLLWEITNQELVKDWKIIAQDKVALKSKNA